MLKLITLGIFSFCFAAHARAPGSYYQVKTDLQKVSQRGLVEWINGLVKASAPSRMVGHPGHDLGRDFIVETIKKLDPKKTGTLSVSTFEPDVTEGKALYQKDFDEKVEGKIAKTGPDYKKWLTFTQKMQELLEKYKSFKGENIIWEKAGLNSSKVLVITAHYDTISHDQATMLVKENDVMPGANYNASGVAVALGLIRVLSEIDLNYSVQIVFLDWQGLGYLGSLKHAKDLKASDKNIMGVLNLEMLGQDTSFFDKTKKTGNMKFYLRQNREEAQWADKLLPHGKKITEKVQFESLTNNFENSDNFRYWDQGFMAGTFSQNWEDDFNPKFYQTPQDTAETLNHDTLYHSFQYIGGVTLGTLLDITK